MEFEGWGAEGIEVGDSERKVFLLAVQGHPGTVLKCPRGFLAVLEQPALLSFPVIPQPQRVFGTRRENSWTWGSTTSPSSAPGISNLGLQLCSSAQYLSHLWFSAVPWCSSSGMHTENVISPGLQEIQGQIRTWASRIVWGALGKAENTTQVSWFGSENSYYSRLHCWCFKMQPFRFNKKISLVCFLGFFLINFFYKYIFCFSLLKKKTNQKSQGLGHKPGILQEIGWKVSTITGRQKISQVMTFYVITRIVCK